MKNIDTILEEFDRKYIAGELNIEVDGFGVPFKELKDFIRTAFAEYKKGLRESISELGHQQEDDTIWCNLDSVLELLK